MLNICWEEVNKINWNFVLVLIELLNILIIFIPAFVGLIYYKIRRLKVIVKKSNHGSNIIIQNISKNTVFIKKIELKCANNNKRKKIIQYNKLKSLLPKTELNPNEYINIKVDYGALDIDAYKKIQIKIQLFDKYDYRKRVK